MSACIIYNWLKSLNAQFLEFLTQKKNLYALQSMDHSSLTTIFIFLAKHGEVKKKKKKLKRMRLP